MIRYSVRLTALCPFEINYLSNSEEASYRTKVERGEYKGEDYKIIWDLRATLENEVDNDSCGDLSESGELVKQRSLENTEEHELIKNVSLASSSNDQKLSLDSGKPPPFNNR